MTKSDLWKIYLWIQFVILILSLGSLPFMLDKMKPGDWSSIIENFLITLVLFSYAFSKRLLPKIAWKMIFGFLSLAIILDFIYWFAPLDSIKQILSFRETTMTPNIVLMLILILYIPAYYAAYQLATKNTKKN